MMPATNSERETSSARSFVKSGRGAPGISSSERSSSAESPSFKNQRSHENLNYLTESDKGVPKICWTFLSLMITVSAGHVSIKTVL